MNSQEVVLKFDSCIIGHKMVSWT